KLFLIDVITGAMARPYNSLADLEMDNEIILPEEIPVNSLKHIQFPTDPFGNTIHYLEHNNFRIVSLHTFAEGTLQQRLYIMNNAEIVYEDLLNSDIQKLQPEAFLLHKDQLIYLKDKSQLKVRLLLLTISLTALSISAFASVVPDSVGVENQNGKKVILHKLDPKDNY